MTATEFDLIVVGAGIAGQSVTRAARSRGLSVLLIDAAHICLSGSQAAVGVMRLSWMKTEKQRQRMKRTLQIYRESGWLVTSQAMVSTYREPGKFAPKDDFYLVNVPRSLSTPADLIQCVSFLGERNVTVGADRHTEESFTSRKGVVLCTGVYGKELGATPGEKTYGATYVIDKPHLVIDEPLMVHKFSPYVGIDCGDNGRDMRIGSSTVKAVHSDKAEGILRSMVGKCPPVILRQVNSKSNIVIGARNHGHYDLRKDYEPVYTGRIVAMTGFGKFGFALAPAVAEEVVQYFMARG